MTLRISGKSVNVGEALRGRVTDRTEEVLRKYFDGNYSGHIALSKDGFGFRTDCALHLDSGITLEADSNAPDAYASADQALVMIEKRLKRYKSRLQDRSARKAHAAPRRWPPWMPPATCWRPRAKVRTRTRSPATAPSSSP